MTVLGAHWLRLQVHACTGTPDAFVTNAAISELLAVLQNFVRTNSWESYTSNAGTTIHLYDGHFCQGECTNSPLVTLDIAREHLKQGILPKSLHDSGFVYTVPVDAGCLLQHRELVFTNLCFMQARTPDLCLQRRARSQVHLHYLHDGVQKNGVGLHAAAAWSFNCCSKAVAEHLLWYSCPLFLHCYILA